MENPEEKKQMEESKEMDQKPDQEHHKAHGHHHKEHHEKKEHHKPEHSKKEETITMSKTSMWKGVSGILAALLLISLFTGGFGIGSSNTVEVPTAAPGQPSAAPPAAPAPIVDVEQLLDDDAVKGDKNAPVTIIEWSDYECPFCARFYSDTYKQIDEKYIKTGKVKLIYRDFPLSFHQQAQKAAEAAECAGEQGKYFDMHDKLFEDGVVGGTTTFKQYAKEIGLDTSKFNTCLDTGAMASEVRKDFVDGQQAGVQGTPGFIVNGNLVSGAQPFSVFEQIIEAELAN